MAPCSPVVSDQPAFWHLDAARGPSTPSLDHLVGEQQERFGNRKSNGLGGLEIDLQGEIRWLHDRQVGRLFPAQNTGHIEAGLPVQIARVRTIADQAAPSR